MKRISRIALILTCLLTGANALAAGNRDLISVQGVLFDKEGEAINGEVAVTFRLYGREDDQEALWSESLDVSFEEGTYSESLGAISPFPNDLFEEEGLYLSMQVGHDSEMKPRIPLYSVPWSRQAEVATTALSLAENSVTAETIAPGSINSTAIAVGAIGADELASTNVTPGTYDLARITVDADGRIVAASNGTAPVSGLSGIVAGDGLASSGVGNVIMSIGAGTGLGTTADAIGILPGGVTALELSPGAVTFDKIEAGAIQTSSLANNAVDSRVIADGAVKTTDIAGGAIASNLLSSDLSLSGTTLLESLSIADTTFVLDSNNVGPGANQSVEFNRGSDSAIGAQMQWDEGEDLFRFVIDGIDPSRVKVADPVDGDDAVTKSYVDGLASGLGDISGITAGTGLLGGGNSGAVSVSVDIGTTAGKILQLDGSGALPAISGANLTNLNASQITDGTLNAARLPTSTSLLGSTIDSSEVSDGSLSNIDINASAAIAWSKINKTGATASDVGAAAASHTHATTDIASGQIGLDQGGTGANLSSTGGSNQFVKQSSAGGALSVGVLTDADVPNGISVDLATKASALNANGTNCAAGQFPLGIDASGNVEGCTVESTGTVTGITAGTGLTGSTITTSGTLGVDVGTTAGKIVQLDGSGALPAVSGANVTNLTSSNISGSLTDAQIADTLTIGTGSSVAATTVTGGLTDAQVNDNLTVSSGTINSTPIGATTPSTGAFTALTLGSGTGTVVSNAVTINAASGVITDGTTDINKDEDRASIAFTNNKISATSVILVSICSAVNAGAMMHVAATPATGSATISIQNSGTSDYTINGLKICFVVIN